MRRFTSLLISIFILTGLIFWGAGRLRNAWAPQLKAYLEKSAGLASGRTVHISLLRYRFPFSIGLIDVEASPIFKGDEILIGIGVLNVPTALAHRRPAELINSVRVRHPQVRLTQEEADRFKRFLPRSKKSRFTPTFFELAVEGGQVEWSDPRFKSQPLALTRIHGLFNWRGPQQSLQLDAKSNAFEGVHISFKRLGHRWRSSIDLEGLDLQKVLQTAAEFKGAPLFPKGVGVSGIVDLYLKAGGKKNPGTPMEFLHFVSSLRWQGTHGKLHFEANEIPWAAHGTIQHEGNEFKVEKGIFHLGLFTGALTGEIEPFGGSPQINLQARGAPNVSIETLMNLAHVPDIIKGKGDYILRMNGEIKNPRLSVQVLLPEGSLWGRPVTHVAILARYDQHSAWEIVEGRLQFGSKGHLRTQGTLAQDSLSLRTTFEQVSIKALYPNRSLEGTLSGAIETDGPLNDWQLRGSWWLSQLLWKDKPVSQDLHGALQMERSGPITLTGETLSHDTHLQAQGIYEKSSLKLTGAELVLPSGDRILAQGAAAFSTKTGEFVLRSDRLSLYSQALQHVNIQGAWEASSLIVKAEAQQLADDDLDRTPSLLSGQLHFWPSHFVAEQLHYERHNIRVDAQANATPNDHWTPFDGTALLQIKKKEKEIKVPIMFKGHVEPDRQDRGSAQLNSGPVEAEIKWEHFNDLAIKAQLDKGGWNTTSIRMGVDGNLKLNQPSTFAVHGVFDPDGQFNADVGVHGRHVSIRKAVFHTKESRFELLPGGTLDFPVEGNIQTHVAANLRNLHLGLLTLFGSLELDGKWSQVKDQPRISVQAHTRSLFINDYELEEGQIIGEWENGLLRFIVPENTPGLIKGSVNFQKRPQLVFKHLQIIGKEGQKLDIDGEMGPSLWNYALAGEGLDLGILGEISGLAIPMSGAANLKIVGRGDEAHPTVEGHAHIQKGSIASLRYESGETDLIWQGDRITFQHLQLKDSGRYTVVGEGVFPIEARNPTSVKPPEINFTVRLQDTNLGLLQSLFPEIKSGRGAVEGLVQIQGTLADPLLRGHLKVENGAIVGAHYFRRLNNISVSADFDRERLHIGEIKARSGKGEFFLHGDVALAGFEPSSFTLSAETLSSDPVEVDVPELAIPDSPLANRFKFLTSVSRLNVKGHVQFLGPEESPIFRGDVTLSEGHFTFPPSAIKSQASALTVWARRIFWDLSIHFQDRAWFENELVEANINGGFKIKGPADNLKVDGGLTIPKGKISYLGLQFDIREARFDMKGGSPFLSGEADSQVQATDTVGLSGGVNTAQRFSVEDTITLNIPYAPLDQIKPRLTSSTNPGLSQEKVVARVTQLDVENLTPEERNYLYQQQAVSLIDNSLTTPLAQKVLKRTGIADRFRAEHVFDPSSAPPVDPITGQPIRGTTAADLFANTKYTVEKDLLGNLSLGYGVRFVPTLVTDSNTRRLDLVSDVQMSYRAFKNVYVRGLYDLPNSNSAIVPDKRVTIEPRWRFGWWGNTNPPKPTTKSSVRQP